MKPPACLSSLLALIVLFAALPVTAQESPKPGQTGKFTASFKDRDPRGFASVANKRLGRASFSPATHTFDPSAESYEIYVPKNYDGSESYGLVVWINSGDNGRIPRQYEPLMDKHRLIWIGANSLM